MRSHWLASVYVAVTTGYFLLSPNSRIQAEDKPDPAAATIVFCEIPNAPLVYDLHGLIEFDGTPQKFHMLCQIKAGATAQFRAKSCDSGLEDYKGLQHKLNTDKRSVTIKGWKDPKTGKFYPVKRVSFTTKTMPKAVMPKVTNPKRPIA